MPASPQLDDDMVNKLAAMLRMIAGQTGEAGNALGALGRVLRTGGKDLVDAIIQRLEQMSEADYQAILDEGIRIGKQEARAAQAGHPNNGHGLPQAQMPDDRAMATYCYQHIDQLARDKDKDFVISAMSWTLRRPLTPKMRPWLEDLYIRLGGRI